MNQTRVSSVVGKREIRRTGEKTHSPHESAREDPARWLNKRIKQLYTGTSSCTSSKMPSAPIPEGMTITTLDVFTRQETFSLVNREKWFSF